MDELAYKLIHGSGATAHCESLPDKNEHTGQPWSSKYLKECYQLASDKFGWAKRDPKPGSMRDGKYLIGWGQWRRRPIPACAVPARLR